MPQKTNIKEALKLDNTVFIDVRAPLEFEKDHILGAVNLPVLDNEERAIVGTIYKQVSQKIAIEKGMKYYEQKIPNIKRFIRPYKDKTIIVYCWRGGMRSEIPATLFESLGYKTFQLEGGYKSYRQHVLEQLTNFKLKPKVYVLWGLTCTGKTQLLQKLPNSLDLEGLAQHRGSLYGAIGLKPRTQKMFDNLLLKRLKELNNQPFVFVEGESRRIGNVITPDFLWKVMCKGTNTLINRSLNVRVKEMVKEYFLNPKIVEEIKEITKNLWRVISKRKKQVVLELLDKEEYEKAAEILLVDYYDPLYQHTLKKKEYAFEVNNDEVEKAVKEIENRIKHSYENLSPK